MTTTKSLLLNMKPVIMFLSRKRGADNTFVISATNSGGGTDFNVKGDVGEATQVKAVIL
ncbi:hypothetical protein INT80_05155 [Gallibacterium anatis]|uniref:Uncharacterized protein n=1 Tax=Gallibacterium anatis TaxID=750 RepID=A0A930YAC6_9PAST|nr:hypothetical protein [Gallibacterium anatis]